MRSVYYLKEGNDMVVRLNKKKVTNAECGDAFQREIMTLHEGGKGVTEGIIASK